jgi:hypothetical protein
MRLVNKDEMMNLLSLFLVALVFATPPSERAIIDVSQSPSISPPVPHNVSFAPPMTAGLGMPPIPSALSLRLVAANDPANQKQDLADLRVQNVSDHSIEVPISRNGLKAHESCPEHTFLTSSISRGASKTGGGMRAGAELYGCSALLGSTVMLMPGDWITIAGQSFAKSNEPLASGVLRYLLEEDRYSSVGDQLKVTAKGIYYVESAATK